MANQEEGQEVLSYPETVWCKFWDGCTKYVAEYSHRKLEGKEGYYHTGKRFVIFPEEDMDMSREELRMKLVVYGADEEWFCTKMTPGYGPVAIDIALFKRGWMKSKKMKV